MKYIFVQYIAEQKLKAFSIGAMGKTQPSKRELSEQKKKEEEHAAAQVIKIFVSKCCRYLVILFCRHLKNL